ncbi:hypothetical protein CR513_21384, partial [Mucuna pruriens]
MSSVTRKRYSRSMLAIQERLSPRKDPSITFSNEDYEDTVPHSDDPMVISLIITDYRVERVLVDQGSLANVLFWLAFCKMGFSKANLEACQEILIEFTSEQVEIRSVNQFTNDDRDKLYDESIKNQIHSGQRADVLNVILARGCTPVSRIGLEGNLGGPRAPPEDKIGAFLEPQIEGTPIQILKENQDAFAWLPADMPGIDPNFLYHRLFIATGVRPVSQRKRRLGEEKKKAVKAEIARLLQAGFIQEV